MKTVNGKKSPACFQILLAFSCLISQIGHYQFYKEFNSFINLRIGGENMPHNFAYCSLFKKKSSIFIADTCKNR